MLVACLVTLSGGAAQVQRQVRNLGLGDRVFRPVTDSMLEKPDPGQIEFGSSHAVPILQL